MKPLLVEICMGTSCYLLGSQALFDLIENLPTAKRNQIDLSEVACFPECRKGPSVRVNGVMLSGTTPDRLLAKLEETLSNA